MFPHDIPVRTKRPSGVAHFLRRFDLQERQEVTNALLSLGLHNYQNVPGGGAAVVDRLVDAARRARRTSRPTTGNDGNSGGVSRAFVEFGVGYGDQQHQPPYLPPAGLPLSHEALSAMGHRYNATNRDGHTSSRNPRGPFGGGGGHGAARPPPRVFRSSSAPHRQQQQSSLRHFIHEQRLHLRQQGDSGDVVMASPRPRAQAPTSPQRPLASLSSTSAKVATVTMGTRSPGALNGVPSLPLPSRVALAAAQRLDLSGDGLGRTSHQRLQQQQQENERFRLSPRLPLAHARSDCDTPPPPPQLLPAQQLPPSSPAAVSPAAVPLKHPVPSEKNVAEVTVNTAPMDSPPIASIQTPRPESPSQLLLAAVGNQLPPRSPRRHSAPAAVASASGDGQAAAAQRSARGQAKFPPVPTALDIIFAGGVASPARAQPQHPEPTLADVLTTTPPSPTATTPEAPPAPASGVPTEAEHAAPAASAAAEAVAPPHEPTSEPFSLAFIKSLEDAIKDTHGARLTKQQLTALLSESDAAILANPTFDSLYRSLLIAFHLTAA